MSIVERGITAPENSTIDLDQRLLSLAGHGVKSVILSLILFLFTITFVAQGYRIYGECMEPNLRTGERILGSKLAYRFRAPTRGDVVVFASPTDTSRVFVKRVIGLPGDMVSIMDGAVFINDRRLTEPYVRRIPHGSYGPRRVHKGHLFVMGDYRDCSSDSREWGQLPISNVRAKAWIRYWPLLRATLVR